MSQDSRFTDETPVILVVHTDAGAVAALEHLPDTLNPLNNGAYWQKGVRRIAGAITAAIRVRPHRGGPRPEPGAEVRFHDAEDERRELAVKLMLDAAKKARPDANYEPDIEYLEHAVLAFGDTWAALMAEHMLANVPKVLEVRPPNQEVVRVECVQVSHNGNGGVSVDAYTEAGDRIDLVCLPSDPLDPENPLLALIAPARPEAD